MIIQDYSDRIRDFEDFLKKKLVAIESISADDSVLFKKILYVSFLDSLSSCVYPKRSNRERFVLMLERFSQWEDRDRISLLHLARFTHISSDPSLDKARNYVTPKLMKWKERTENIPITEDPKSDDPDIKPISWKSDDKSGIKLSLDHFKHSNLLYQLRNALVHQFQSRGDEQGKQTPGEPFYQVVKTFDESQKFEPLRIELIYPVEFLKKLSEGTLKNIIEYLRNGNINPFPYYYAGEYWLAELN